MEARTLNFTKENIESYLNQMQDNKKFPIFEREKINCDEKAAMMFFNELSRRIYPNFVLDGDNSGVYCNLIKWALGHDFECYNTDGTRRMKGDVCKGIFLFGSTGTGKSVALSLLNRFCEQINPRVRLSADDEKILQWKTYRTTEVTRKYANDGDFDLYVNAPFIGFDDLGSEQEDTLYMGNRLKLLRQILEIRGDRQNQMTLITSNLPFSKITEFYGDRVASRLVAMCNFFYLGGKDRRI